MLTLLSQLALAAETTADALFDVVEEHGHRTVNSAAYVGLDLRGARPGVGARIDLGHRMSVDGSMVGAMPIAEGMKWLGGASLGFAVAPVKVHFGSKGSVDLRVGVGGSVQSSAGMKVSVGSLDWSAYTSATLEVSPDGRWTVYGGLLADQLESAPTVVPLGGVRLRLE